MSDEDWQKLHCRGRHMFYASEMKPSLVENNLSINQVINPLMISSIYLSIMNYTLKHKLLLHFDCEVARTRALKKWCRPDNSFIRPQRPYLLKRD